MKSTKQIQTANPKLQPKTKVPAKTDRLLKTTWAGRVPQLKPGQYADGLPLHQVEYLCCKLILRPNRFTSRQSLFDFAKVLKGPANEYGVGLTTREFRDKPLKIREVLFMDT